MPLEKIEALIDDVRSHPKRFPDIASLAAHADLDIDRLEKLLRQHYHATSVEILKRARLAQAKQLLLKSSDSLARIVTETGYDSMASFSEDFIRFNALSALSYRALAYGCKFTIQLPETYTLAHLLRTLGRDNHSVTEHLEDHTYTTGIRLGDDAFLLTLTFGTGCLDVSIDRESSCLPMMHAIVIGLLGLEQDSASFARLVTSIGLERLVEGRTDLRLSQTHSFYTGLLWTIIGQQINMPFARILQRRLIEKTGVRLANGLYAPPTPQAVASLDPAELLPLQFSRQKADYVISISRLITSGQLDLNALSQMSATRAEQVLLAIRGLGPWSVNYLMMRSLGFADCLPLGDTGVSSGVISLFALKQKPSIEQIDRLLQPLSPFRSLATAHLWQLSLSPASGKNETGTLKARTRVLNQRGVIR